MTAGFPFPVQKKGKKNYTTVKLGFKERLNKEQLDNNEPYSVTNMPVHLKK